MAEEYYTLPEAPVYNAEEIRKIQDSAGIGQAAVLRGDGVDGIGQLRDGLQGGVSGHHSLVCGQPGTGCILGGRRLSPPRRSRAGV